jgi:hypothetical protein
MANGNNNNRGPKPKHNPGAAAPTRGAGRIGRARQPFQWGDIPSADVAELITAVTGTGAAVICGVTSDGGALSVTILDGDERLRDWPSNLEEFGTFMDWVRNTFAVR